jgi:predicted Zn-dependent peptidase
MRQASSRPGFDHFEAVLESVRSITVEEVAAVCRRYFTADPVLVAVGPEGEGSEK